MFPLTNSQLEMVKGTSRNCVQFRHHGHGEINQSQNVVIAPRAILQIVQSVGG